MSSSSSNSNSSNSNNSSNTILAANVLSNLSIVTPSSALSAVVTPQVNNNGTTISVTKKEVGNVAVTTKVGSVVKSETTKQGPAGAQGPRGLDGRDGLDGRNGIDGQSITDIDLPDFTLIFDNKLI